MKSRLVLLMAVALIPSLPLTAEDSDRPHWGTEGGFGFAFIPGSLTDVAQNRYSASLGGHTYSFGLVHFHSSGAPSYSLQFTRIALDGQAVQLNRPNAQYEGHAAVSGFLASKHLNFVARRRFSFGISAGAGVGPQLKADYTRSLTVNGIPFSERKTYTLKDIPVTPLFEFQIRGEVRLSRNLSAGPWVGIRDGIPLAGGVVRVHFLKPE